MHTTFRMFLGMSALFATLALVVSFALALPVLATAPNWDTSGDYIVAMEYQGNDYSHDVTLTQDGIGNLSGNGGSPAGDNTYLWTVNNGMVNGDTIAFTANYTATADAVNPQTTIVVEGTVAANGTMSGTWSDNYEGNNRSGTWKTTSGVATQMQTNENDSSTITVTIDKFINGSMATPATAQNANFPMKSTWDADNVGSGSGTFTLSENNTVPYRAITADMTKGADYSTKEMVNGDVVGAQCANGKPFALQGYSYGNTHAAAMTATPSMNKPSFTNLQHDMYVIVWNRDCALPEGQIGGDVVEGDVLLEVTSVEMIKTTATANGTFTDGWKYIFSITAPTNQQNLAMKFDNWMQTNGSEIIPVANNMRISSLQASNNGASILLTEANAYSTPQLHMTGDLNPNMDGRQVEVTVEVAVPVGTANGSYTTSYGVQSQ